MLEAGASYSVTLPTGKTIMVPAPTADTRAAWRRKKNILAAKAWRLEQKVGTGKKRTRPRGELVRALCAIAEFRARIPSGSILSKRRKGKVTQARWWVIGRLKRLGYYNGGIALALGLNRTSVIDARVSGNSVGIADKSLPGSSVPVTISPATQEASV